MTEQGNIRMMHAGCAKKRQKDFQKKQISVLPGDHVKVAFTKGGATEHMWVLVQKVSNGWIDGILDNIPLFIDLELGDKVTIRYDDISQHIPRQ